MTRPYTAKSITEATGAGPGEDFRSKGHNSIGLFVSAPALDTDLDDLDVQIEVSPNREWWAVPRRDGNQQGSVSLADFNDQGAAFVYVHGLPADHVRARITTYTDTENADLVVDAWLMATNRSGSGNAFKSLPEQ